MGVWGIYQGPLQNEISSLILPSYTHFGQPEYARNYDDNKVGECKYMLSDDALLCEIRGENGARERSWSSQWICYGVGETGTGTVVLNGVLGLGKDEPSDAQKELPRHGNNRGYRCTLA
jgi:hypothetical protein